MLLEGLIVSCRRMLSVEDRAAIMVGLEAGLSQVRTARPIGPSPSVVCREIARHLGPGSVYKAQDADRAAQVAKRRPKKRLLYRDEALRRRVIADLSQGRTPRQISAHLSIDKWVQEKEESLKKLERLYSDKLALAAPKEHWDERAAQERENAAKWTKITALTAAAAVALSTIAIVVLYSFDLPKIPFLSTSFIAIAMITFMIYIVRVFVKITLSSRHLQMAYEQKSALTYFYLSLGKHKGELTEEERVLAIQSLFTPVDTGLVKASELPDFNAALALLTKRTN